MNVKGFIIGYLCLTVFISLISFCVINIFGLGAAFIDALGLPLIALSIMGGSAVGIILFKKYIHLFD